jgi:DnaJ-class molecular chaperone
MFENAKWILHPENKLYEPVSFIREIKSEKKIKIEIKKGTFNRTVYCLKGLGENGYHGGQRGDLNVVIKVRPNEFLARENKDTKNLVTKISINPYVGLFGGEAEIYTLDGIKTIKIPKNTKNGQTIAIKGLGIDDKSDLLVHVDYADVKSGSLDQKIIDLLKENNFSFKTELPEKDKKRFDFEK